MYADHIFLVYKLNFQETGFRYVQSLILACWSAKHNEKYPFFPPLLALLPIVVDVWLSIVFMFVCLLVLLLLKYFPFLSPVLLSCYMIASYSLLL